MMPSNNAMAAWLEKDYKLNLMQQRRTSARERQTAARMKGTESPMDDIYDDVSGSR